MLHFKGSLSASLVMAFSPTIGLIILLIGQNKSAKNIAADLNFSNEEKLVCE